MKDKIDIVNKLRDQLSNNIDIIIKMMVDTLNKYGIYDKINKIGDLEMRFIEELEKLKLLFKKGGSYYYKYVKYKTKYNELKRLNQS